MGEPEFHKPIFGAVWRYPETDLRRLQRVGRRGFIRLALLVPLTLALVSFLAIGIVSATSGISLREAVLMGFALATFAVIVLRGWMLGTFVNGNGFKIVTLLKTRSGLWKNRYKVQVKATTWRPLGLPIGIKTRRVVFFSQTGDDLETHIYLGSVDAIFTQEKFDIFFQLLRRWSIPE
jgi:hypothetical protein